MVAELVDALDVFPADAVGRHGVIRRRGRGALARGQQGPGHVVGVRGLGQIVHRPGLHRRHRGGDVAVAGQHDHPGVRPVGLDRLHHLKPVAVLQPHVQHREGRRLGLHGLHRLLDRAHQGGVEPAGLQGPAEPVPERRIVIEQEQGPVRQGGDGGGDVGHGRPRERRRRVNPGFEA